MACVWHCQLKETSCSTNSSYSSAFEVIIKIGFQGLMMEYILDLYVKEEWAQ
jgi:hypothetical protein